MLERLSAGCRIQGDHVEFLSECKVVNCEDPAVYKGLESRMFPNSRFVINLTASSIPTLLYHNLFEKNLSIMKPSQALSVLGFAATVSPVSLPPDTFKSRFMSPDPLTETSRQQVLASPASDGFRVVQARDLDEAKRESSPTIVFTGPVFADGPNVTLTGTAKSISEQISELNPDYDPWASPDYKERMESMGFTKDMSAEERKRHFAYTRSLTARDGAGQLYSRQASIPHLLRVCRPSPILSFPPPP